MNTKLEEKQMNTVNADMDTEKTRMELERKTNDIFKMKDMLKQMREDLKILEEAATFLFHELEEEEVFVPLDSGEVAHYVMKPYQREVLDKDSLAQTLQIAKNELKTPWDFSMLTKQGKITPKMIAEYTETKTTKKMKISRKKNMPKKKKREGEM